MQLEILDASIIILYLLTSVYPEIADFQSKIEFRMYRVYFHNVRRDWKVHTII